MINAQEMICKSYGYTDIIQLDHEEINQKGQSKKVFDIAKKNMKHLEVVNNNREIPCAMCGNIHPKGYVSSKDADSLLSALTKDTFNECYSLEKNNFICEFCGFSTLAYGSPSSLLMGKKMVNTLVINGEHIDKNFNSNKDNELYEILKNPPKPPFVILINSRGKVLENLVYSAKATISKECIVVNYGLENLVIEPVNVFEAIEEARHIAKNAEIEVTSDHIWNRQNDLTISLNNKLRNDTTFLKEMSLFIAKYDRDCRIVSKMILLAYLNKNKKTKESSVMAKEKETKSLFSFD